MRESALTATTTTIITLTANSSHRIPSTFMTLIGCGCCGLVTLKRRQPLLSATRVWMGGE